MPIERSLAPARTPSRRHLLRGVAWATPAVAAAVAAPALAASCDRLDQVIDWDAAGRYVRQSSSRGIYTLPVPGQSPMVSTVTANWGAKGPGPDTLTTPTNMNGVAGSLLLAQAGSSTLGRQTAATITVTFSRPVSNLRFTIGDIDGLHNGASGSVQARGGNEQVVLGPIGFTYAITDPGYLDGNGTERTPFRVRPYPNNANPNNETDAWGNVAITYPGTISSFTLTTWIALRYQEPIQSLSDMTFDLPCLA